MHGVPVEKEACLLLLVKVYILVSTSKYQLGTAIGETDRSD